VEAQLQWLHALQAIEDRLRALRDGRKTRRCLLDIAALEKERIRLSQQLDPRLLRRFEILLERRQGKAMAPIRGKSCGACGLVLPEQTVVDVQTMEFLISCESCNRFLYWDHEEERKREARIAAEVARAKSEQAQGVKTVEPVGVRRAKAAKRVGARIPVGETRQSEPASPEKPAATKTKPAAKGGVPKETVTAKKPVDKNKPAAKKPVVKKTVAKKAVIKKPSVKKSGVKESTVKESPHRKRTPGISRTPKKSSARK